MNRVVEFGDDMLSRIAAALPPETPPERAAVLPKLLRAWVAEDLVEHLTRQGRASIRQQQKRLAEIGRKASDLLETFRALDEHGRWALAIEVQKRREIRTGNPRWVDMEASEQRRDEALSWLYDLADALAMPQPRPPPDVRTLGHLVVLDLAAIYELVTRKKPTRQNNPYAANGKQAYGPFFRFVTEVCKVIGIRSIDRALRDVMEVYPKEGDPAFAKRSYSAFVANLQFRHPQLWQVLR